ncbi:GTPase Era [Aquiluna sp. KACHI24]|uniref:GTPase Era n=1 Tax=Aquiluna sp. KACHI24 TaxID=2968831 RepID=UPI0021FF5A77|nr:GTPase Era [Aquiluna sp. KACHI24]BDQ00399.1 GTPase Era [Aquiluna sp. KACHI24]
MTKSGFASFVGRPNVGKSTLTNALVGEKIAITSSRPQTTRKAIRGIVSRPAGQLVLVDLPGVHRPRTLLGERLNDLVQSTLSEVDLIAFCTPANEKLGPGDERLIAEIQKFPKAKKIAIVTKTDSVSKERLLEHLLSLGRLADFAEIVPVSALTGDQVDLLADLMIGLLPEGPLLYPAEVATDESLEDRICESIREKALEKLNDELPHSLAVTLDEFDQDQGRIFASVWVERDSQKGIVIGKAGSVLKAIGSEARAELAELIGRPIYLSLQVRVAKEWQRDPKQLGKLGF